MATLLERRRAIEAAKAAKLAEEERQRKEAEARRHPLLKWGASRSVRDAYFLGLVFAAIANDDEIDARERSRLEALGVALELSSKDVAEAIESLLAADDDAKMAFIAECARELSRVEVAECFLKEFEDIWQLGGGRQDEVAEFRTQLISWMRKEVKTAIEAKENAAAEARRKAEEEEAAKQKQAEEERRAAEDRRKREAELAEARRTQAIFENASVKLLFSAWKRCCGAYCKGIPELTYKVLEAGRLCVHGIVLPRNYLKDIALKFLSGSVSPSFQGRGEAEWVKDRGVVLGILLLHYIGSSDFNPYGEEAEDLRQIYQLARRQSIQDRLVAHIHKYLEIE